MVLPYKGIRHPELQVNRRTCSTIVKWLGKRRLPTLSEAFHNGKHRSTCACLPSVQDGSGNESMSASAFNFDYRDSFIE